MTIIRMAEGMANTETDTDMEAVVRKLGNLAALARDLQRFRESALVPSTWGKPQVQEKAYCVRTMPAVSS